MDNSDVSMMIPVRLYTGDCVYVVHGGYTIVGRNIDFVGYKAAVKGKSKKLSIPAIDVEWFEFRGGGIQTLRCADDVVRNTIFKEWVKIRSSIDVTWSDYLHQRMDEIFEQ